LRALSPPDAAAAAFDDGDDFVYTDNGKATVGEAAGTVHALRCSVNIIRGLAVVGRAGGVLELRLRRAASAGTSLAPASASASVATAVYGSVRTLRHRLAALTCRPNLDAVAAIANGGGVVDGSGGAGVVARAAAAALRASNGVRSLQRLCPYPFPVQVAAVDALVGMDAVGGGGSGNMGSSVGAGGGGGSGGGGTSSGGSGGVTAAAVRRWYAMTLAAPLPSERDEQVEDIVLCAACTNKYIVAVHASQGGAAAAAAAGRFLAALPPAPPPPQRAVMPGRFFTEPTAWDGVGSDASFIVRHLCCAHGTAALPTTIVPSPPSSSSLSAALAPPRVVDARAMKRSLDFLQALTHLREK
jgi:hypothetical protein